MSSINIALPKGHLMNRTADLLAGAGWDLSDYSSSARLYRLSSGRFPDARIKILQDKDIPVQVSIGSYDLGICGLEWAEELLSQYPSSSLVKIRPLGYGRKTLYACVAGESHIQATGDMQKFGSIVRIATEYPNLTQQFAASLRLRHFVIVPVWGRAERYPPEDADMVVISVKNKAELNQYGLKPIATVLESEAVLVANTASLLNNNMAGYIAPVLANKLNEATGLQTAALGKLSAQGDLSSCNDAILRLALPDGHQQAHVKKIFDRAGICLENYPSSDNNWRPSIGIEGIDVKVIRPQDMPLQVANGRFDVAITGRDWLYDHLYRFPTSPLVELIDLKYGRVKIVSVVDGAVEIEKPQDIYRKINGWTHAYRIATEYVSIADRFAQEHQIGRYCIIPTWGATEAFVPEDADMLIENTETGGTIARHNLKIIDTLFISTACLVGREGWRENKTKADLIQKLMDGLAGGIEG